MSICRTKMQSVFKFSVMVLLLFQMTLFQFWKLVEATHVESCMNHRKTKCSFLLRKNMTQYSSLKLCERSESVTTRTRSLGRSLHEVLLMLAYVACIRIMLRD